MKKHFMVLFGCCALLVSSNPLQAAVTGYTSEAAYLDALATLGHTAVAESFEDAAAWGSVRTTIVGGTFTAPAITSQGVTWTPNNPNGGVTTGPGPARTGNWGFFTLPHGDFLNGVGDGFIGTSTMTLYGVGGWFDGTFGAEVNFVLDDDLGDTVDFDGDNRLSGPYLFLGVVDTTGFHKYEIIETEFTPPDEAKFIFSDDFTFGITLPEPTTNGDLDKDGDVDDADLNLLLSMITNPPSLQDTINLEATLSNFGRTDLGPANGRTVPEPSSLAMILLGVLFLMPGRTIISPRFRLS